MRLPSEKPLNTRSRLKKKCLLGESFTCFLPSGFLPPKVGGAAAGGDNEVTEYALKDQMEMMVKRGIVERGIVEQCCHRPCNIFDLQNYCN